MQGGEIYDNDANRGGGIYSSGGVSLTDVVLTGNEANTGGGFFQAGGFILLQDCILAGNTATTGAGGAFKIGVADYFIDGSGGIFDTIVGVP
jgi:hypothetical protein